jgi:hypothetical protein
LELPEFANFAESLEDGEDEERDGNDETGNTKTKEAMTGGQLLEKDEETEEGTTAAEYQMEMQTRMQEFDTNKDGKLTLAEFIATEEAMNKDSDRTPEDLEHLKDEESNGEKVKMGAKRNEDEEDEDDEDGEDEDDEDGEDEDDEDREDDDGDGDAVAFATTWFEI